MCGFKKNNNSLCDLVVLFTKMQTNMSVELLCFCKTELCSATFMYVLSFLSPNFPYSFHPKVSLSREKWQSVSSALFLPLLPPALTFVLTSVWIPDLINWFCQGISCASCWSQNNYTASQMLSCFWYSFCPLWLTVNPLYTQKQHPLQKKNLGLLP